MAGTKAATLVIRRQNGLYFIVDRVKDMIVSGGANIYSTEVENVLSKHPSVAQSAVIGIPDEKWGEAVKALVPWKGRHDKFGRAYRVLQRIYCRLQGAEID